MKYVELSKRVIYRIIMLGFVIVLCLLYSQNSLYASESQNTIKIGGTGTALGSFKELAEAFMKIHPDIKIVVLPSLGSGGGIKAVNERALDIGLSSRPLKDSEQKSGMASVEYARTPFVFVTAKKTEGLNFTLNDIAGIYSGETKKWPDGTTIRLVLRPESDMDTTLQKGMSPEMDKALAKALAQEGMMVAFTDQESADAVEKINGAIGTSTLAQIISEKRELNPISLDGVVPNMKNLEDGSYRYFKTLYLVTGQKAGRSVAAFIDFVNSPKGRNILLQTGHLFVKR